MPRPVWFEIPADDVARAVTFYKTVFGWELTKFEGWPDYWMVESWHAPQACLGGAIMSRAMGRCTRNTVDVPSLDEFTAKVLQAGGTAVGEKMAIPGGTFGIFADTEGNEFGLMEPAGEDPLKGVDPAASSQLAVVHFEIPADDVPRAIAFYETVFGWKIAKWDGPMDYWLVDTGPATEAGMHGGLTARQGDGCPSNTVSVPDVDEYSKKVEAAGGTILMPKMEIPGVGWMAACKDTEGNQFGIIQPE